MKKFTLLLALFIVLYLLPGCAQRTNLGGSMGTGSSYPPFIYDSYGRIIGKLGHVDKYGLYYYNPYYDLYFPHPYYYNSLYHYPYSPYPYYFNRPYYNVYRSRRYITPHPHNYNPQPQPSNPSPPPSYKPPPQPRPSPPPPRRSPPSPPPPARQLKSSTKKELE